MAAEETQPSMGDSSQDADPFMKLDNYDGQIVHKKILREILDLFGDIVNIIKEEEPQYRPGLLQVLGCQVSVLAAKLKEDVSHHFVKAQPQAKTGDSATSTTATTAVDDEDVVDEKPTSKKPAGHARSAGKMDEPDAGSRRSVTTTIPILGDDAALSSEEDLSNEEDLDDGAYPSRKKTPQKKTPRKPTSRKNMKPASTDPSTPNKQTEFLPPIPPTPFTTRKPGDMSTDIAYRNIYNDLLDQPYEKWGPGSKKNKKSNVFNHEDLSNMLQTLNSAVSSDKFLHRAQTIIDEANTVNKKSGSAAGTAALVRNYINNHKVEGELGSFLDQYAKVQALTADRRPAYDYMLSSYESMKLGVLYQHLRNLMQQDEEPGKAIRNRMNAALSQVAHRRADLRGTTRIETLIKTYLTLISDGSGCAYDESRATDWDELGKSVDKHVNNAKGMSMLARTLGEGSAVFVTKDFVRAMKSGIYKWQDFLEMFMTHIPEIRELMDILHTTILKPCVAGKAPRRDLLDATSQEPVCDLFRSARARIEEIEDEELDKNLPGGLDNDQNNGNDNHGNDNHGNDEGGKGFPSESGSKNGDNAEEDTEEDTDEDSEEDVAEDTEEESEETSESESESESGSASESQGQDSDRI